MIAAYGSNLCFPKRMPGGIVALLTGTAFVHRMPPKADRV